jgi:hypothetical protein
VSTFMRVVAFLTGLLPVSCHYTVTAPLLWAHNISAAFDAWLALWVFCVMFLGFCCAYAFKLVKP